MFLAVVENSWSGIPPGRLFPGLQIPSLTWQQDPGPAYRSVHQLPPVCILWLSLKGHLSGGSEGRWAGRAAEWGVEGVPGRWGWSLGSPPAPWGGHCRCDLGWTVPAARLVFSKGLHERLTKSVGAGELAFLKGVCKVWRDVYPFLLDSF